MEEQILIDRCRKGDNIARHELYNRFAGRLLSICARYSGDRDVAEDLLHDTFIRIFKSFDKFTYRGEGSLRAWIERIAVNISIEYLRTRQKLNCMSIDEGRVSEIHSEPDVDDVRSVPRDVLMQFVAKLPDGYRSVFNLYCIEEHSHKEIAELLGINEKTSSSQLYRAKVLLAKWIKTYLGENKVL